MWSILYGLGPSFLIFVRINFRGTGRCGQFFMDWAHNFLFSCSLIFVVQVGAVNSLWTGPIIFNFRAH